MTFTKFQASGRDVPDLRTVVEGCQDMQDAPMPGRAYVDDSLYIEQADDGTFHLTLGNESLTGSLPELELELYEYAITEGHIDGPTEREELIEALEGLMNYVGGWDSPPGHPCRIAADLLARIGE